MNFSASSDASQMLVIVSICICCFPVLVDSICTYHLRTTRAKRKAASGSDEIKHGSTHALSPDTQIQMNKTQMIKNEQQTAFIDNARPILPDDVILEIMNYAEVPTLSRIKSVCRTWMRISDVAIENKLPSSGRKQFIERRELIQAVHDASNDPSNKAETLAGIYGWPMKKWDVSQMTNFAFVFKKLTNFNEDIRCWDTSKAVTMEGMFAHATSFNRDLSKWNTSKVRNMNFMFLGAKSFNQDISRWNVSQVKGMCGMFSGAVSFNQDISTWNIANVENVETMFFGAKMFNKDISTWNTSKVKTGQYMLFAASSFNLNFAPKLRDQRIYGPY